MTRMPRGRRARRVLFFLRRYLPAEVVGTLALLGAGLAADQLGEPDPVIALSALVGESLGFYGVLAVTVYREQWTLWGTDVRPRTRTIIRRTGLLLAAEFGPTEVLDSLIVRPALLLAGVWLIGPVWGILAGKVVADLLFYAIAALAFTVTEHTGARRPVRSEARRVRA